MAVHRAHLLELLHVPDLHLVVARAHRHAVALLDPREARHVRALALRLHELLDGAVGRVPQVDGVAERHAEHVGRGPVEQIEVEVIQFLCCNILEQLASVDFEIGLTILELGGVSLIEESMMKHSNSDRVKKTGDAALRTLLRTS